MSNAEDLADQYEKDGAEHLADQYEKDGMGSHHGGKQRTKKESEMNTNRPIPAGHERKIAKLRYGTRMLRSVATMT